MKIIRQAMFFLPMIFLSGCSADSPLSVLLSPPKVDIVKTQDVDATSSSFFQIIVTVKNDGNGATAYNVGCNIKLKNGNYIVETGTGYFGTLEPGESTSDAVWFTNVSTSADFHDSEIIVYWWDSQSVYYQN